MDFGGLGSRLWGGGGGGDFLRGEFAWCSCTGLEIVEIVEIVVAELHLQDESLTLNPKPEFPKSQKPSPKAETPNFKP